MDDLKEKIYLLALDIIKNRKAFFICDALIESYEEYTGTEKMVSYEELKELFPEFFSLYDGRYWCSPKNRSVLFVDKHNMHQAWWHSKLVKPRKRILELILGRGCR